MILDKLLGAPELLHPNRKPVTEVMQNLAHPLSRDLLGRWLINEGASNTAFDLINQNHATVGGAPSWVVDGVHGKVLDLDGTNDHLAIPDNTILSPANDFTITAWVYLRSTGGNDNHDTIVSKGVAPYSYLFTIGNRKVNIYHEGPATWLDGNTQFALNTWIFAGVSWDGATRCVWLNGVCDNSVADTTATSYSAVEMRIGDRPDHAAGNSLDGYIEDVRVYGRALPASEHWQIYTDTYQDLLPVSRNLWIPSVAAAGGVNVDSWYTIKENPVLTKNEVISY